MNEHGPISVAEGAFMYGRIALASWAARIVFGGLLIFLHMSGGLTLINVFGSFFVAFVIAPGARFQQEMLRMKRQGMDISSMPAAFLLYAGGIFATVCFIVSRDISVI